MSELALVEVDPSDEVLLRAAWEVLEEVAAERPYDASTPWETFRAGWTTPRSDSDRALVVALHDGLVVAAGVLALPLLDNAWTAHLGVSVRAEHRRRGVGSALLTDLERRAAAAGRTTWTGGFHAPVAEGGPGSAFADAHGYDRATEEEIKVVDLDAAAPSWPALDEEVAAHLDGYRVETFVDGLPEEWVEDFCALLSGFVSEIPTGDLDVEDATWTPARLAEHLERSAAEGKAWLGAVAVTPGGRLCGFTELEVVRSHPVRASVGGTLVTSGHRGHRLGLALKLASHRRLRELYPACAVVLTGNAGINAEMGAVNAALGYEVVERWLDVQKRVATAS